MILTIALRDRLPSAAAAIAVQAGLLALLLLSFEAMRQAVEEKETILTLAPRAKVRPRPEPVVIDARGKKRRAGAARSETAPPGYAQPSFEVSAPQSGAALQGLDRDLGACDPGARAPCMPARPRDDRTMAAEPEPPVKNAPIWQSEIQRRNTPPRVPCVSLTNSVLGMDGFVREDHGARIDVGCALKAWREGPALLPPVGAPDPDPPPAHATDAAFGKALAAVQTHQRALYGRPAPVSAPRGAP